MGNNGQTATAPKAGQIVKQEAGGALQTEARGETAAVAVAAAQEALVKARCALARHSPRDIDIVRVRVLKDCQRPLFAEAAIYSKPVGKKFNRDTDEWEEQFVEGPSVRLAEALMRHMGNMFIDAMVVADDGDKRIVKVMAMDLETNATDAQDVTIEKVVERRGNKKGQPPEGRIVLGERFNTYGDKVFRVVATEDELLNKTNSAVAKMRRNKIVELCPADIVEEAMAKCRATMAAADAKDPDAARRRLIDSFMEHQVAPEDLRAWLGHELDKVTATELQQLRKIYAALENEETTWSAIMEARGVTPAAPSGPQAPPPPPGQEKGSAPAAPADPVHTSPQQPAAPAAPPQPPATPPAGSAWAETEAKLEQGFAEAKVAGDLTKLVRLINGLPEERRAHWRGRYNARSQELVGGK